MAVENIPPSPKVVTQKSFRVKPSTGAGGARRALACLGNNNSQLNLRMAQSLLTISQEGFLKKWNFDPVKEVPLVPGRYQWAPVCGDSKDEIATAAKGAVEKYNVQSKNNTKPTLASLPPSATSRVPDLHEASQDTTESDCIGSNSTKKQEKCVNEVKVESNVPKQVQTPSHESLLISKKTVSSNSQMCITDFLRPHKRNASYLYEDCKPNTTAIKKLRALH